MAAIILCRPSEDLEVLASTNIVSGNAIGAANNAVVPKTTAF